MIDVVLFVVIVAAAIPLLRRDLRRAVENRRRREMLAQVARLQLQFASVGRAFADLEAATLKAAASMQRMGDAVRVGLASVGRKYPPSKHQKGRPR